MTSPWWGLRGPRALMVTQIEETRWAEASLSAWFLGLCKVAEASFWVTVGVKKQLHIPRPRDIVTLMSHSAVWGQGFRGEHGTVVMH